MSSIFTVTAPGKVIITGEHSVVYGYPALVAAVNRHLTLSMIADVNEHDRSFFQSLLGKSESSNPSNIIEEIAAYNSRYFQIKITSDIPIGSGMGSSAALAVALSYLLLSIANNCIPQNDEVNQLALKFEKKIHQNPSGVDNTVITYGGAHIFQKSEQGPKFFPTKINLDKNWWIVSTGRPDESTGEMVGLVKERYDKDQVETKNLLREIGETSESIIQLFEKNESNKESIKEAIKMNHNLLFQLGVVSHSAAALITEIESAGGAAKISGAGGKKNNSGILLVYHDDSDFIHRFCSMNKFEYFPVTITSSGVQNISL